MSKFPEQFPHDVQVEDVDLDTVDVRHRGEWVTEDRAEQIAAEVLSRAAGCPPSAGGM